MTGYEKNWKDVNRSETPTKCCPTACGKCMKANLLLILLLVGIGIGIGLGALLKVYAPPFTERQLIYFTFPGDLLMRMLKCLIIPLIVSSLVAGLGGLDTRTSGQMGLYAIVYYLTTTILAVMLGILLVMTIKPGKNLNQDAPESSGDATPGNVVDSFLDIIRNIFPDNIVEACFRQTRTNQVPFYGNSTTEMNETWCNETYGEPDCNRTVEVIAGYNPVTEKADGMNILGLVVFSIALGIVTSKLGEEARPLYHFAHSLAEGTMVLVTAVIWYSPIGILFLVAAEIIKMEDPLAELEALGLYIATVVSGLVVHGFIVLPLIYLIFVRKNPFTFLLGALQALLTAFGTASSAATLPVTYRCLEENNHIDPRVTRFVLPVGATINMDGTALYEAVAAIFIAQSIGMELDAATVVTVSLTATLASIGAASVPQAGLVTMIMVLTAIGIDPNEVTKILAVDWLLDRIRTMINVWGDAVGSAAVYGRSKEVLASMDNDDSDEHSPETECQQDKLVKFDDNNINRELGSTNLAYVPCYERYHGPVLSTKF